MKKFTIELSDEIIDFYKNKVDDTMDMETLLSEMLGLLKELLEQNFSKIFINLRTFFFE